MKQSFLVAWVGWDNGGCAFAGHTERIVYEKVAKRYIEGCVLAQCDDETLYPEVRELLAKQDWKGACETYFSDNSQENLSIDDEVEMEL